MDGFEDDAASRSAGPPVARARNEAEPPPLSPSEQKNKTLWPRPAHDDKETQLQGCYTRDENTTMTL